MLYVVMLLFSVLAACAVMLESNAVALFVLTSGAVASYVMAKPDEAISRWVMERF